MRSVIITSLQHLSAGRTAHQDSQACGVNNVYACGLPGYGKTLTVEKLMKDLMVEQTSATMHLKDTKHCTPPSLPQSTPLPRFTVISLQGNSVINDSFYQAIAAKLGIEGMTGSGTGSTGEKRARDKVLARFRNDRQCKSIGARGGEKEAEVITILMIDEIDKAPRKAIKELLEIGACATHTSASASASASNASSSSS